MHHRITKQRHKYIPRQHYCYLINFGHQVGKGGGGIIGKIVRVFIPSMASLYILRGCVVNRFGGGFA